MYRIVTYEMKPNTTGKFIKLKNNFEGSRTSSNNDFSLIAVPKTLYEHVNILCSYSFNFVKSLETKQKCGFNKCMHIYNKPYLVRKVNEIKITYY